MKKPNEYDEYKDKKFKMNDVLHIGSNVELVFKDKTLKAKLESITKEHEINTYKRFVLTTNKFTSIIQLASVNK